MHPKRYIYSFMVCVHVCVSREMSSPVCVCVIMCIMITCVYVHINHHYAQAWIHNATLRDNIIMNVNNEPMDFPRYWQVLKDCALVPDLVRSVRVCVCVLESMSL
jgi:hypothetical protein